MTASVLSCVLVKPASLRQLTRAITGAADRLAARSTPDASVHNADTSADDDGGSGIGTDDTDETDATDAEERP